MKYIKATKMQGIMIDPEGSKSSKVYSDADFCRKCHRPTAGDDPSNAKSWTGYDILYACFPIIWCSKLQTQIALSTTEADYIALPQSLRDEIPMM